MNGVNQFIDFYKAVSFGNIGKVSIACGGFRTGMSENSLDVPEGQAAFEQVRCKAVPEGMDMDFFLMPHSSTTTFMAF